MGILLALLGSPLGETVLWVLPLLPGATCFVYCAGREERLMTELFPQHDPAYMRRTRMLAPCLLGPRYGTSTAAPCSLPARRSSSA